MKVEESLKRSHNVVEAIKQDLQNYAIKNYTILPLVNIDTGKTTGHRVEMQISTKYYCSEDELKEWKKKLGANMWNIRVYRNRLVIRFFIHYNEEREK